MNKIFVTQLWTDIDEQAEAVGLIQDSRGGFRAQNKVVTNFCKINTIYIKATALIFVVIVVVIIIIVNIAILFCFEILVVTA